MRRCKSICWNNIQIMIEEEYHKSSVLHIWSWTQCHTNAPSDATGLSVLMNCWATSAADAVNVNGRTLSMKRPLTRRASWWDVRSYVPKVYSKTFSAARTKDHTRKDKWSVLLHFPYHLIVCDQVVCSHLCLFSMCSEIISTWKHHQNENILVNCRFKRVVQRFAGV